MKNPTCLLFDRKNKSKLILMALQTFLNYFLYNERILTLGFEVVVVVVVLALVVVVVVVDVVVVVLVLVVMVLVIFVCVRITKENFKF